MKQSLYTLTAAVFFVLCTACTQADIVLPVGGDGSGQEDGGDPDKEAPLVVESVGLSLEIETRSLVTGGPEGANNPNPLRSVGICVTKPGADGAVNLYSPGNRTQVFTYSGTSWVQAAGGRALYLTHIKGTVCGFAPSNLSANVSINTDHNAPAMTKVVVRSEQTFSLTNPSPAPDVTWEINQEDYLYGAGAEQVDRRKPGITLTMRHVLAKVSFRVMETDGGNLYAGKKVASVKLQKSSGTNTFKRTPNGGLLNLSTGEMINPGTFNALTFSATPGTERPVSPFVTPATEVPVQAFGLAIPVKDLEAALVLTLDDGDVLTTPPFAIDWEKGTNYIYTVTLSPKGIGISNPVVAPWVNATITNPNIPVQ